MPHSQSHGYDFLAYDKKEKNVKIYRNRSDIFNRESRAPGILPHARLYRGFTGQKKKNYLESRTFRTREPASITPTVFVTGFLCASAGVDEGAQKGVL